MIPFTPVTGIYTVDWPLDDWDEHPQVHLGPDRWMRHIPAALADLETMLARDGCVPTGEITWQRIHGGVRATLPARQEWPAEPVPGPTPPWESRDVWAAEMMPGGVVV